MIRSIRFVAKLSLVLMITGCSMAPAFDVMGSLFPAWLLCIALGVVLATVTRWLLTRRQISLPFPFLTFPCLGAVYTFAIWLVFF